MKENFEKIIDENIEKTNEKIDKRRKTKIDFANEEFKQLITSIVLIILSIVLFNIIGSKLKYETQPDTTKYYGGKVLDVKEEVFEMDSNAVPGLEVSKRKLHTYKVKVTKSYSHKDSENDKDILDKIVDVTREESEVSLNFARPVKKGDKITFTKSVVVGDENIYHFAGFEHGLELTIFISIFVILVILIAKLKGFNTIALLFLIGYALIKTYVPALLVGVNVYLATFLLAGYSIIIGMIIINGLNHKTYAAILGNLIGILFAGLLAYNANKTFHITGIGSEEDILINNLHPGKYDLIGITWAAILIGALGAIMDTALSIASSIKEIAHTTKTTEFKTLFKSGMEVGKDAISTMISTLLLAYISGTLVQTMLMHIYTTPVGFLFNTELILEEIIKSIIGATGILITVPATAFLASAFEVMENKANKNETIK